MIDRFLRTTLAAVAEGRIEVDDACRRLADWRHERLPFATIDHHRVHRNGFPEVVYCDGKTPDQAATVAGRIHERCGRVLATRAGEGHVAAIRRAVPGARHNPVARTLSAGAPAPFQGAPVVVVTAGTSDLPVAEEAVETVRMFGEPVEHLVDVGVAGIHRVLERSDVLDTAGTIVVVAGMDGALPSVVAGLVKVPVVAVPTSVGYGASFEGLAALLTMLNSCAAGVTVVNIDNGFGAGFAAARINGLRRQAAAGEEANRGVRS
ncbi:MAG: nickel pincer cofactor biosynthesis protein LarB [Gemmatimonadetes bacterium]|nr:nickel pincer cofactor biosynthesis protein LarB [Gemmatimonadota bacterium]